MRRLNFLCNFIASFIQSCDDATYWLRSSDDSVQVKTYANAPARNVYLTGGYEAIFGASACLSGEDDGVVQYASIYACGGSATAATTTRTCAATRSSRRPPASSTSTARTRTTATSATTQRLATRGARCPDGIWTCSGSPCSPNTRCRAR